jgi:rubrerythrin
MNETFHTGDLLKSLIALEKTGHAFYEKAAKTSNDENAAKLFEILAKEEARHEKIYTDLAAKFQETAPVEETIDEDYNAYLQSLVTRNFRFDEADFRSLDAALRFAISLEKDTLIYVGEIQNILKGRQDDIFETIKKEERKHLRLLTAYEK